jgi:polysaccharide deacetylase family protein (PEP-CTERM system associated)
VALTGAEPHLFSVDVEDWFQVNALEPWVARARWPEYESRVEASTDRVLALLDRHGAHGTFFTLGWVAERHPALVRRIAEAGHEVASHGWWHRKVTTLTPDEFRADLRASKAVLEETSGQRVLGFRAPSFSLRPGMEWAFDVLLEEGYEYDSSLFPIRRPDYGWPGSPAAAHWIERPAGRLLELPLATTVVAGVRLPAAGGGYLRQLPIGLTRGAFRSAAGRGEAAMFYIHPWELDPGQPRLELPWLTRVRHYRGLDRTEALLERLLGWFDFTSVARKFGLDLSGAAPAGWSAPAIT